MFAHVSRRVRRRRATAWLSLLAVGLTVIAAGCGGKSGSLSPLPDCDGTHLLMFTSGRNLPAGEHDVFLYDLDAGGFRALLNFAGAGADQHPAISSDGKVIAVERTRAGTGQDVLVYERCSGGFLIRPELVTAGDETEPAFSGDTHELAFVRDTAGTKRLRLYDGASQKFLALHLIDSLAATGFNSESPSLDRTGNLIAFVTGTHPTRRIHLYSRAGDSLFTTLDAKFASVNDDFDPWLTPDAHYLAFASDRPGGKGLADVYLWDLVTESMVVLDSLNSAGNDVHPTLSPDLRFISFQSDRTAGPLVKGKWDLYNYSITLHLLSQAFQE